MMPLNYSKWDQLELSDDSDIEGHPNVDHKSLVRWKQRDIHEKRQVRNMTIAQLEADIACNSVLRPRIAALLAELQQADDAPALFSRTVARLRAEPAPDAPAPGAQTYDAMIYALLLRVYEDVKGKGIEGQDARMGDALQDALKTHLGQLDADIADKKAKIEEEKSEKSKKITSEDIHEGFESKYVPAKPAPPPVPGAGPSKGKAKAKETTIEVLNPKAAAASAAPDSTSAAAGAGADDDDEDDTLPEMTPSLTEFSKIGWGRFEQSYEFIKAHREVVVPGASDALLIAAFRAARDGKEKYARQCVHQSLLLQYCEKIGGDGVRMFFMKMISGDRRAIDVFVNDAEGTYTHLLQRAAAANAEDAAGGGGGAEQIQLVPQGEGQTISFNVPDGPPPVDLRLEGEGTENLDLEEVRKALQMRWDIFSAFDADMQEALRSNELDEVNKVLGAMSVEHAEDVVQQLDMAGILNFAEGGIRDETPAGKAKASEEKVVE